MLYAYSPTGLGGGDELHIDARRRNDAFRLAVKWAALAMWCGMCRQFWLSARGAGDRINAVLRCLAELPGWSSVCLEVGFGGSGQHVENCTGYRGGGSTGSNTALEHPYSPPAGRVKSIATIRHNDRLRQMPTSLPCFAWLQRSSSRSSKACCRM